MSDLMEYLYRYAEAHFFRPALAEEADYESARLAEADFWSQLEARTAGGGRDITLQDYRDAAEDRAASERRAMFRAGLRMGTALDALYQP